ncbi:MAG: response regulator [Lachnospiraceae bacterium]|nr:response regulator [Lachnospiraceae bacterium]
MATMKKRVLLAGTNQSIIDDFFYVLNEDFESMTTSMRTDDIMMHMEYFKPDAFVYCIGAESKERIQKLANYMGDLAEKGITFILIGDAEACEEFMHIKGEIIKLVVMKPFTAVTVGEQLKYFLVQKEEEERQLKEQQEALAEAKRKAQEASVVKHVLVIDDDPIMLRIIKERLKDEYNVATAVSGRIGLNFLSRKKTNLILLDYEMPDMDGAEVLEKIRERDDLKEVPVIFLTGINDTSKIQKVLAMKPQGYLLKPIDGDKLINTIRQTIK